jgi:SAM-dependent methyltransferase
MILDERFFDRGSPDFAARRAEARKRLDSLDPAMRDGARPADPLRRDWFTAVYALAEGDPARVPWANLTPHPLSQAFVAAHAAAAAARVTAFDLVAEAIAWAKQRFPESKVAYAQGDLFALPDAWHQTFDLVHECYTLQALSSSLLPQALAALKSTLAPGGRLLLVARAREEADEIKGPPWPLPPSIFEVAKRQGLEPLSIEDIPATAMGASRHWRALLRRAEDGIRAPEVARYHRFADSDIATQNFEAAFNEQIVDRLPFCHCARKIVGDMPPRYDETMQRRDRKFVADPDCQTVFRNQMFGKQATENTGLIHGILHL